MQVKHNAKVVNAVMCNETSLQLTATLAYASRDLARMTNATTITTAVMIHNIAVANQNYLAKIGF